MVLVRYDPLPGQPSVITDLTYQWCQCRGMGVGVGGGGGGLSTNRHSCSKTSKGAGWHSSLASDSNPWMDSAKTHPHCCPVLDPYITVWQCINSFKCKSNHTVQSPDDQAEFCIDLAYVAGWFKTAVHPTFSQKTGIHGWMAYMLDCQFIKGPGSNSWTLQGERLFPVLLGQHLCKVSTVCAQEAPLVFVQWYRPVRPVNHSKWFTSKNTKQHI